MAEERGTGACSWIKKKKVIKNEKEILDKLYKCESIECSKEEFENALRQLLSDVANKYLMNGDTVRAKFVSIELKRLELTLQGE